MLPFWNRSGSMSTLTIKNVPAELHEKLRAAAARHRRSINSEVIVQLENSLRTETSNSERLLEEIRARRERLPHLNLNDDILRQMKNEGRQ
jgi:plasmid stability protein